MGGAGAYLFDLTVPGGAQVPTAGVMAVGVLPTHRRRGVLSKLMQRQLADAHERGEPLALLYASEGHIYSRFGYGLASLAGSIDLPKEHALLWDDEPIGQARILDGEEETLELLPGIYDRVQAETPGMFTRTREWWQVRRLHQRPGRPGGEQVARRARARRRARGLRALPPELRRAEHGHPDDARDRGGPRHLAAGAGRDLALPAGDRLGGPYRGELAAARPSAPARGSASRAAWISRSSRRSGCGSSTSARRSRREGSAKGRSCSTSATSSARGTRPAGTSTTAPSTARRSRPTSCLGASELGSVYLGGFTFDQLLRAGRLEELKPGGVARADELFRTARQPSCPEIF